MALAEAKEELKVLNEDFMAFLNADNNEINVVRKNKNDFELLRPEKELVPEEAVKHLQQSGDDIIIFNNKTTMSPSVVFRRKSGNFGLIEPEA